MPLYVIVRFTSIRSRRKLLEGRMPIFEWKFGVSSVSSIQIYFTANAGDTVKVLPN